MLVFDKDFRWVKEFGYRGSSREPLRPGRRRRGRGKVYVSQYARRGVSVFEVKVLDAP